MDSNGIVYSNIPLNLREIHHIRLGLVTNLNMLSKNALDRLRLKPLVLIEILKAIYPSFDWSWLGGYLENDKIKPGDWERIMHIINPPPGTNPFEAHPKYTVGSWDADKTNGGKYGYGSLGKIRGQIWFDTVSTFFIVPG